MTDVEKLVAVEQMHGVSVEWLGHLLWYTVADCRITRDELEALFAQAGLPAEYLPNPINARDAFRRATKAAEVKREQLADGKWRNLLVREVASSPRTVIRHLVSEVVDSSNKRLDYREVVRFTLDETRPDIEVQYLSYPDEKEKAAVSEALREYSQACVSYDGRNVREVVWRILADCAPVSVRTSGGVYFVPRKFERTVEALKVLVKGLRPYVVSKNTSSLWSVPVVNAEEQRQMVEESLDEQVKVESERIIKEMTELLQDKEKKITKGVASEFVERTKRLARLVREYEESLSMEISAAQASLETATAQARKLLLSVE